METALVRAVYGILSALRMCSPEEKFTYLEMKPEMSSSSGVDWWSPKVGLWKGAGGKVDGELQCSS